VSDGYRYDSRECYLVASVGLSSRRECVYLVPMLLGYVLAGVGVVGYCCGFGSDHLLRRRRGRCLVICGLVWCCCCWFIY
jgi:hypothetical protein